MQASKELLSQNEIKALLDVLSSPSQDETSTNLGFEWRMAKVANSVKSYLDGYLLSFDEVKVSKEVTLVGDYYTFKTNYPYLESLHFDNAFALQVIAARFGAEGEQILTRALSTLEEHLLEDVCREIVYIVEKELDERIVNSDEHLSYRELNFYKRDLVMKLGFDFRDKAVSREEIDQDKTVVEAIVGRLDIGAVKKGAHYKVEGFTNRSVVLMFDKTLCFNALKSSRDSRSFSYVLQDACESALPLEGYYLIIGSSTLEDELYMSLSKGSMLRVSRLADAEIHKDGKIVAKVKLQITGSEMVVEVK